MDPGGRGPGEAGSGVGIQGGEKKQVSINSIAILKVSHQTHSRAAWLRSRRS